MASGIRQELNLAEASRIRRGQTLNRGQATAVVEKMVTRLSPELQAALTSCTLPDEALLGVSTLRGAPPGLMRATM